MIVLKRKINNISAGYLNEAYGSSYSLCFNIENAKKFNNKEDAENFISENKISGRWECFDISEYSDRRIPFNTNA